MIASFQQTVLSGSLALALPVALLAGLVSFASPCVLPLVPGYLSYMTGLSGAELASRGEDGAAAPRMRLLAGSALFVAGFTAVFVAFGALFGGLGGALRTHAELITQVLGAFTVLLGLCFLGAVPFGQRTFRLPLKPSFGLVGAPLLGVLFGLGWTPCIGPTLAAVQTLAFTESSAGRGAVLATAYCVGLGAPFLLAALAYRRALGAFGWVRHHAVWVVRLGGGMLVLVGILLLTGVWDDLTRQLQGWISGYETVL